MWVHLRVSTVKWSAARSNGGEVSHDNEDECPQKMNPFRLNPCSGVESGKTHGNMPDREGMSDV